MGKGIPSYILLKVLTTFWHSRLEWIMEFKWLCNAKFACSGHNATPWPSCNSDAKHVQPDSRVAQATNALPSSATQADGLLHLSSKDRRSQEYRAMASAATSSHKPQTDFIDQLDNSNTTFKGKLSHWKDLAEVGFLQTYDLDQIQSKALQWPHWLQIFLLWCSCSLNF